MKKNSPNSPTIYKCDACHYTCRHKGDWNKHLTTRKHKMITMDNKNSPHHICECGKKYMYKSGLSKHKLTCKYKENKINPIDSNVVLQILEENKELRKMMLDQQDAHHKQMMDMIPKIGNTNNTNKFNLNIFLNEHCKDAINWDEFVKSIQVNVQDLELLMESNITNGITNALCNGINELGVYKRPIHCLDIKRKKICIKNQDTWEYNNEKNKTIMDKYNKKLQHEHIQQLHKWQEDNPNWQNDEHLRDVYIQLTQKVVGNINGEKCMNEIIKQTIIPKEIDSA